MKNKESGVTLIVLVISIIVLLLINYCAIIA